MTPSYIKDLERVLDTRKEYWTMLILSLMGFVISIYIRNYRLIVLFVLAILLLLIFKKDLYLYGTIRYIKCKMMR